MNQMGKTRTVLISGGDRGIGAAAVRAFCAAGCRVAFTYHTNTAAARALEAELGGAAAGFACDVARRADCQAAFVEAKRFLGHIDVLVSNAGIAQQKLFTDITPEEWQRMMDVNLSGTFHLCQLVLPDMIRRRYGRILTVSSMWGQTGGSCEVHYSAAKAGLIGLTKESHFLAASNRRTASLSSMRRMLPRPSARISTLLTSVGFPSLSQRMLTRSKSTRRVSTSQPRPKQVSSMPSRPCASRYSSRSHR